MSQRCIVCQQTSVKAIPLRPLLLQLQEELSARSCAAASAQAALAAVRQELADARAAWGAEAADMRSAFEAQVCLGMRDWRA